MRESDSAHNSYDVLILGGGPAGSATAIALKRLDAGLRIALLEKTSYSSLRIGETLPPPAQATLASLGVWDAFLATSPLQSYGTRAAWGSAEPVENEFIFSPYGHGWHVDRRAFDAMLAREAERAGVEICFQAKPVGEPDRENNWTLKIQFADGSTRLVSARFVVDATGRRSWFACSQGLRHLVYDHLAGVFLFFRFDHGKAPADTYTMVEACEKGWWYSSLVPNGSVAVALMTDASALRERRWKSCEEWCALTAPAPHTARRIAGAAALGKPVVYPASSQRLENPVGDNWLAAGDAASTFDPLSSQGIIKALRSGIRAGRAICRHLRGDRQALADYAQFVEREFSNYLAVRAGYYRLEQRWPDLPFWRQRFQVPQTIQVPPEEKPLSGGTTNAFQLDHQHQPEPHEAAAGKI